MINIIPLHNKKLNCFQDTVATIARYYNTDYELMLLNNWGFSFKQGSHINPESINNLSLLEDYHGINVKFYYRKEIEYILNSIYLDTTKNKPISAIVDTYYIPWDKNYGILHNPEHILIITGISFEKEEIYCIDSFYKVSSKILPFNLFQKAVNGYIQFKKNKIKWKKYNWKELVIKSISDQNYRNRFEDMYKLSTVIEEDFDYYKDKINKSKNLWHSSLIFRLGGVARGRLSFSLALEYLMLKFKEKQLIKIINYLVEIADDWNMIRILLVKGLMTRSSAEICKNVSSRIRSVAEKEKETYNKLYCLL